MSSTLSPLAQKNLAALKTLTASIAECAASMSADLDSPENQSEEALTGDEIFGAYGGLLRVFTHWRNTVTKLVAEQPEFHTWLAAQESPEKPGLNG